ncbi:MAG: nucleotidyltransferase domain-containing protein [Thermoflexales bacterium]
MNLVTMELIDRHRPELEVLCREYRVRRLDVFGSILNGQFDPAHSDVDFLVEYLPGTDLGSWLARYFELRDALSAAVGVQADVLMADAVANPYLRRSIERNRITVYASEVPEVA